MDDDDRWMHSLSGGWRGYLCGVTSCWSVRLRRLRFEVGGGSRWKYFHFKISTTLYYLKQLSPRTTLPSSLSFRELNAGASAK